MDLSVVSFGKLKTAGLRDAADHYIRGVKTWASFEEIELKPQSVPDKSASTRTRIQGIEGQELLARCAKLPKSGRPLILLDEGGKALPTLDWAKQLKEFENENGGAIFVVGSSLGFSGEVRARARARWSLGPQTLPHELARVVLLEQRFRARSASHGHPYHNEGSG